MKKPAAVIVVAALILTACGGGGAPPGVSVWDYINLHTACPQTAVYANPTWSPDPGNGAGPSIYYTLSLTVFGIAPNTQTPTLLSVLSVRAMSGNGSNDRQLVPGRRVYAVSRDGALLMLERPGPSGAISDYDVLDLATMAVRPVAQGNINPA